MKKVFAILLTAVLLAGSALSGQHQAAAASVLSGEKQTVVLYNNKIEIVDALDRMAATYNSLHENVEIIVDTTGSDDYAPAIRTRFAGGEAPDIFVITGTEQMLLWFEYLEDLSGEPWVGDMVDVAKPMITHDGKIYGFPFGIEGYGFMYNKDLFQQAGITQLPKTPDELEEAVEKLKAIGIEHPFVDTFGSWYQAGMFWFSAAIAQQPDPFAFIDGLNSGAETIIGNEAFRGLANMIDISFSNCRNPLNTDFATQVATFAGGSAAIASGGTWNQPTLDDANPGLNVGLMPYPLMADASDNDVLFAGVTNYWSVNVNSPAKQAAKDFLTWLATDPVGQRYLTTETQNIPAFYSVPVDNVAIGWLGQALAEYQSDGKIRGIYNSLYTFAATQEFGTIIQKYAAGNINQDQFLQELQAAWNSNMGN